MAKSSPFQGEDSEFDSRWDHWKRIMNIKDERDALAEEVRKLKKHANAMKVASRLRKIYGKQIIDSDEMHFILKAAECIDSLLREIERMERNNLK